MNLETGQVQCFHCRTACQPHSKESVRSLASVVPSGPEIQRPLSSVQSHFPLGACPCPVHILYSGCVYTEIGICENPGFSQPLGITVEMSRVLMCSCPSGSS